MVGGSPHRTFPQPIKFANFDFVYIKLLNYNKKNCILNFDNYFRITFGSLLMRNKILKVIVSCVWGGISNFKFL
jgi:hypothetical protein